ncbi:hypothetical protein DMUE_6217, partial [Dictyocoela muelleri]
MTNESPRKARVPMKKDVFDQVKRLYKTKSKEDLIEITSLSRTALNVLIKKIETFEGEKDPTFEDLYKISGRKKKNKESLHTEIRSIIGNDNSLTLLGCIEKLSTNISISQLSREIKSAGLSRKRIKKRSNILLTPNNNAQRQNFCSVMLGKMSRCILFLDESGFNLHTSTNYGYSCVNEDAFLYQPASKGQNISLCGIISCNGI